MRQSPGTIARYTTAARINHWITAGTLILLALSGMSLFHPALFFLSDLFGGGPYARAIHPWFGVVLLISFTLLFIRFARHNLWNRDDSRWMGAAGRVLANDEEHAPDVGRYNAAQKLVFWAMTLLIAVLFVTGLVIWDAYFFPYTTIEQKRLAQLLHSLWLLHTSACRALFLRLGITVARTVPPRSKMPMTAVLSLPPVPVMRRWALALRACCEPCRR